MDGTTKNGVLISAEEYAALTNAKNTLIILTSLLEKELSEGTTSYIDGKPYMTVINAYWESV